VHSYNKRREDFETLRQYNDYLEHVEDLVSNLVHRVNVKQTSEEIERYRRENAALILTNQEKAKHEQRRLLETLKAEQRELRERRRLYAEKQREYREQLELEREMELEALESGREIADAERRPRAEKPTLEAIAKLATLSIQRQDAELASKQQQALVGEASRSDAPGGSAPPAQMRLPKPMREATFAKEARAAKANKRDAARAGGYSSSIVERRAIQQAFDSIDFELQ
jgi:CDK-activating kinase assembly factor MAT1